MEQALATSLTKLGVDYVDLYLMHWPMAYDASGSDCMACLGYPTDPPLTRVVRLSVYRQYAATR